jgi:putative ABC transport system permease protein
MLIADVIHHALRAIVAQRLRSFLTLLGIAVGIAAVILLTSIGEGIHRFVLTEFTQFGTNIASVSPGKVKTSGPAPTGIPRWVAMAACAAPRSMGWGLTC